MTLAMRSIMYSEIGKAESTLRLLKHAEEGRSSTIPNDAIDVVKKKQGTVWKETVDVYRFTDKYVLSEIKNVFDAIISEKSTVNFGNLIELNGNVFAEETPVSILGNTNMNSFMTYLGEPQLKRPEFKTPSNYIRKVIVDSKQIAGFKVTNPSTEIQCNIYEGLIKEPRLLTANDVLALEIKLCGGVQEVIESRKKIGQTLIQKPQSYEIPWYWRYREDRRVMSLTSA